MEKLIVEKLQNARKTLRISQSAIKREIGYNQSSISQLEKGEAKFIPNIYLTFLAKNNINLTALFNNEITLENFNEICQDAPKFTQRNDICRNCAEKDKQIVQLREHLQDLRTFLPKK